MSFVSPKNYQPTKVYDQTQEVEGVLTRRALKRWMRFNTMNKDNKRNKEDRINGRWMHIEKIKQIWLCKSAVDSSIYPQFYLAPKVPIPIYPNRATIDNLFNSRSFSAQCLGIFEGREATHPLPESQPSQQVGDSFAR